MLADECAWSNEFGSAVQVTIVDEVENSHRVYYFRQIAGASKIFITFGIRNTDFLTKPFGMPFLTKAGFDHLHIAQAPQSQYQKLTVEAFLALVHPLTHGKQVLFYGSSLGAYAALYYGRALDAKIIAASPILPAHPIAKRYPKDKMPISHSALESLPPSDQQPVIFYDPFNRDDNAFLQQCVLPCFPGAVLHPLEYSGHQSLRVLQELGLLQRIVIALAEGGDIDLESLRRDMTGTSIFNCERALGFEARKEFAWAIEAATASINVRPGYLAFNVLIRCHLRLGQLSDAHAAFAAGRNALPNEVRLIDPPMFSRYCRNPGASTVPSVSTLASDSTQNPPPSPDQ